ncbi:MAG TPA: 2-hydroxyacid dehydrogenase [Burkholderiaceae bacterium]|nr:2-hydroxyacid dehydrogenase [Burkholderiaceae bacterium]
MAARSVKPEVLAVAPLYTPAQATLQATYQTHLLWEAKDGDALVAEVSPRIDVVVTSGGGAGIQRALMEQLPQLKLIACFSVGLDSVDLVAARERGIAVTNTPDVLTDDVADLAIGLVLATARRMAAADRFVRAGRWLQGGFPLASKASGKRMGIVGMGRIGQAIARRAAAFDMQISWHGPAAKDLPYRFQPQLIELARSVDFLVAACPGGTATRGLISRDVLGALGPKGIFINISRGSVVDEAAMVELLANGQLGGAGLDVFADEPRAPAALFNLDNVVLQPHQASATDETRGAMAQLVLDNIAAYAVGRPLLTPVN